MQKQDFLLKYIETFFNGLKKILKMNYETPQMENFEETCDDFLRKNLGISLEQIEDLDLEKYQHLIFNENNRELMVLFFLRIAKFYQTQNTELSQQYFNLSQRILKHSYLSFKLLPDETDKEIDQLLKHFTSYASYDIL